VLEAKAKKVAERLKLNLSTRPVSQAARQGNGQRDASVT
jgi:hypothetical protein